MQLNADVAVIKGVGQAIKDKLQVLGVNTVRDLIYFFPRKYEDYSKVVPIARLAPGKVTVKGRVESITGRHIRRGLHITEAVIADDTSKTRAVWFNQSYRAAQMSKGQEYFFSGEYGLQRNRYVLQNPAAELAKSFGVSTARIVPIYHETAGFKSHQIRKIIRELLPLIAALPETLPGNVIKSQNLLDINTALATIHFPDAAVKLDAARERIAFEELLWLVAASRLNKRDSAKLKGYSIPFKAEVAQSFTAHLPFTMTAAQKKAAWEILQDFAQGVPMNRLLQGDVGSGKTVVAAMAAFMVARAGLQTAFMAPTEILATQHAQTLASLLEPLGLRVGLLLGSTKAKAKQTIKEQMASGGVDVVIGTHALIQKDNHFKKLALVVIDEQHRFGVKQRSQLLTQGAYMPHLLSITATPIPRSLQLTVYGELEVSILDELPKGRQPIVTKVISPQARITAYRHVDEQIAAGRQVYIICPLVAPGVDSELKSVEAEHQRLNNSIFKHRRIGLLHGQLKAEQKEAVMGDFKNGKLDILVCTTVVEVGVDVPNATIMLIEGAERFGLAQLHQLRGRVGRGEQKSYCYLVPTSAQNVGQRLRELEQSSDGFYLAEVDLKLRGPGEIYGRAQHGQLDLSFVNLADTKLIKRVQAAADWLVDNPASLVQYKQLSEHIDRYRRLTRLN
jgi:ATP-dependent DNA helicase RecG